MKIKVIFILLGLTVKGVPLLFESENGKLWNSSPNPFNALAKVSQENSTFEIRRKIENLRENSHLRENPSEKIIYTRNFTKSDHSSNASSSEIYNTVPEEFSRYNRYRKKRFESGNYAESEVPATTTSSSRETFVNGDGILEEDFTFVPTDMYTTENIFRFNGEFKNNLHSTIFPNLASASIINSVDDITTHDMEHVTILGTSQHENNSFNHFGYTNTLDVSQSVAGDKNSEKITLFKSGNATSIVLRLTVKDDKVKKIPQNNHLKENRFVENKENTLSNSNFSEKVPRSNKKEPSHNKRQVFNIFFPITTRRNEEQEAGKIQLLPKNKLNSVLNMSDLFMSDRIDDRRFLSLLNQSTKQISALPKTRCLAHKNCPFKAEERDKYGSIVPSTEATLMDGAAQIPPASTLSPIEQIKQLNKTVNMLIDLIKDQGLLDRNQNKSPSVSNFEPQEKDDASFKYTDIVRDGLRQVGNTIVDGIPMIPHALASGLWQLSNRIGNYTPSQNIKVRNSMPQGAQKMSYLSVGPVEFVGNNNHQNMQSALKLISLLQDSSEEEELSSNNLIFLNQSQVEVPDTYPNYVYQTYNEEIDYIDQDDETAITNARPTVTRITGTTVNGITSLTQEQKIIFGTILIVLSALFIYGSSNSNGDIALPLLVLLPVAAFIIYSTQNASGKRSGKSMSWILRQLESYPEKINKYR